MNMRTVTRSQQIVNNSQGQHQYHPMFHFNYGQPNLSMGNHRQANPHQPPITILNCSTNIIILIQVNFTTFITKLCKQQTWGSWIISAIFLFFVHMKFSAPQKAVERGRKGACYERDWLSKIWCSKHVSYNTSLPE